MSSVSESPLGEPIHERLFRAELDRVRELREADNARYDERFRDMERATTAALAAAEKAVDKSDLASEKRFDSVNEFRALVSDIIARLMPRKEAEDAIGRNAQDIKDVTDRLNTLMGRSGGLSAAFGYAVAAIAVIVSVATFVITNH